MLDSERKRGQKNSQLKVRTVNPSVSCTFLTRNEESYLHPECLISKKWCLKKLNCALEKREFPPANAGLNILDLTEKKHSPKLKHDQELPQRKYQNCVVKYK